MTPSKRNESAAAGAFWGDSPFFLYAKSTGRNFSQIPFRQKIPGPMMFCPVFFPPDPVSILFEHAPFPGFPWFHLHHFLAISLIEQQHPLKKLDAWLGWDWLANPVRREKRSATRKKTKLVRISAKRVVQVLLPNSRVFPPNCFSQMFFSEFERRKKSGVHTAKQKNMWPAKIALSNTHVPRSVQKVESAGKAKAWVPCTSSVDSKFGEEHVWDSIYSLTDFLGILECAFQMWCSASSWGAVIKMIHSCIFSDISIGFAGWKPNKDNLCKWQWG